MLPIAKPPDQEHVQEVDSVDVSPSEEQAQELWDPPVGLSHLEEEQQSIVREMLRKEPAAFARDENDVGCIDNLELEINLSDDQPVQKNYVSIPKPLYGDVKEYLEDLINRNWISKYHVVYSSLMVCVRKKDGSLRLCIDYRELNRKTYPKRQPIPRIQDILNGLGEGGGGIISVLLFLTKGRHITRVLLRKRADPLPDSSPLGDYINGTGSHLV